MNAIKRLLGIFWMALSPATVLFLVWQGSGKIGHATVITRSNIILQWSIILIIFTPICIGLLIFGFYSFKGEYDQLPKNSADID